MGKVSAIVGEPRTAVSEMAAARRLEQRPAERVHDVVTIVRLLVKAGEFEAARRTGGLLLGTIRAPTSGGAGVAVLPGPPALAARLVAGENTSRLPTAAANDPVKPPPPAGHEG